MSPAYQLLYGDSHNNRRPKEWGVPVARNDTSQSLCLKALRCHVDIVFVLRERDRVVEADPRPKFSVTSVGSSSTSGGGVKPLQPPANRTLNTWTPRNPCTLPLVLCDTHDSSRLTVDTDVTIPISPRLRYTAVYRRTNNYRETTQLHASIVSIADSVRLFPL